MKIIMYFAAAVLTALAGNVFAGPDSNNPAVPDIAMVKQFVTAYSEIGKGMRSKTPDWAAINAQFELTLPVLKEIDSKYKTHYVNEIRTALKNCAANKDYAINDEVVGKAFQIVTVLAMRQELDSMAKAKPADMKADAEKIAAYFEAIRPTFARRDKGYFEGKKTLEAAAENAIKKLQSANKSKLLADSRQLEDVIARTYGLSVLYELTEIERLRDSDVPLAKRHQVEGQMVYRIIQSRIEKNSPKINEILLNTLNGSFGAVNSAEVEKYLSEGLDIKLR